jgi:hypothetical protein
MGHDGTDKAVEQQPPASGLTSERAASISTENQGSRPVAPTRENSWTAAVGLDSLSIPPLKFGEVNGGSNQINDCATDKCMVGGKQYKDSTEIPGNQPKPLLHPDGSAVLGPDGKPIYGPDRIDLDKIATEARNNKGWFSEQKAALNFRHSGDWDFQRMKSDDGRPIFTKEYQNFANIGIGYIMGALGVSMDKMSGYADTYCKFKCSYNEPMSPQYPHLAERQVKDFQIGFNLYKERHPDGK